MRRQYPKLHLGVQNHIVSLLPPGEAFLEHRLGNRIADVAWLKENIIFEIQCSSLSPIQAHERIKDYGAMGFSVVWILHQKTFNHKKVTPLERFLSTKCFYFTNITKTGHGEIYTQFEIIKGSIRTFRSPPFKVHLASPIYKKGALHFYGDLTFREKEISQYGALYENSPPLLLKLYNKGLNYLLNWACD